MTFLHDVVFPPVLPSEETNVLTLILIRCSKWGNIVTRSAKKNIYIYLPRDAGGEEAERQQRLVQQKGRVSVIEINKEIVSNPLIGHLNRSDLQVRATKNRCLVFLEMLSCQGCLSAFLRSTTSQPL